MVEDFKAPAETDDSDSYNIGTLNEHSGSFDRAYRIRRTSSRRPRVSTSCMLCPISCPFQYSSFVLGVECVPECSARLRVFSILKTRVLSLFRLPSTVPPVNVVGLESHCGGA